MTSRERSEDRQEWLSRGERGSATMIRLFVWLALHLGRGAARLLLYPVCLYFLVFSRGTRAASRDYLARVLGRPPGFADIFRHYHAFATCVLDRLFLLNDQLDRFELRIEGEAAVIELLARGGGCFLFGAHLGSFEVLRAVGRRHPGMRISLAMYEENARKIGAALRAINPALALDVVALGSHGSMLEIEARLEAGHAVGVLADRGLAGETLARLPFLGSPAGFPVGPFRMMTILRRPVVLMIGLYRGGRRYDIHFERLADPATWPAGGRAEEMDRAMRRYAERLEHYCRIAPFNWFNFYDFWKAT
jgi:predicted LPLAT superfamily acyltransferase